MTADQLFSFHRSLLEIPSVYPNELACSDFLANHLSSLGYTVEKQLVSDSPIRHNIYAYLGQNRNPQLILNSHLDLVPPYIEFSEDEETVYGRGACDAKGSVAVQVTAVEQLRSEGAIGEGDIGLLYVVGEENDHIGMIKANDLGITPKFLVVGEPTELLLAKGHKGAMVFTISAQGRAAHSGYPELGHSATEALISCLYELKSTPLPVDSYLGPSTLNIAIINGGVAPNVVAADASAKCSIRVSTEVNECWQVVKTVVQKYEKEGLTVEKGMAFEPVRCEIADGFKTGVMSFFTDIPYLKGNHKSYLIGPGSIHVAHGEGEFVKKKDLIEGFELYKRLIVKLLQK